MSDVRHNIIDIKNNIDKYLINTPVLRFDFIDSLCNSEVYFK